MIFVRDFVFATSHLGDSNNKQLFDGNFLSFSLAQGPPLDLQIISQYQKYYNTLYLSSKILHKHYFYFLLGLTTIPRETGNNANAKFCVDK